MIGYGIAWLLVRDFIIFGLIVLAVGIGLGWLIFG